MSLIESKATISTGGVKKTIDERSMSIALEVLQNSMYQYPIQSAVREVSSNAVDAVKERNVAKSILKGETKIEDHYATMDGDIYHSSHFDSSYYDLGFLSGNDIVQLIYQEGDASTRDTFHIKDHGVGLGGDRLENYFTLNYSSKRTSKDFLGSFGLGSKSPLATGCESFRMISTYNGQKYTFDIYLDKIESVCPKFSSGKMNNHNKFQNGYEFYSENTTEKNGVEIIIETKKHHRREYSHAVKSQLLYFKNLSFEYIYEGQSVGKDIEFKADILYEDDDVVLSNNSQYSAPHIILGTDDTKVSYGKIDFDELEMEHKSGSIGLKVNVNELAVTPSRESVIWNTKTRKAILNAYNKIADTAALKVQEELSSEKDFLQWVRKVTGVLSTTTTKYDYRHGKNVFDADASIVSILSNIIDTEKLEIAFSGDKTIKFQKNLKKFIGDAAYIKEASYSSYRDNLTRDDASDWAVFNHKIYLMDITEKASNLKDRYVIELNKGNPVTLLKLNTESKNKAALKALTLITNSASVSQYSDIDVPADYGKDSATGIVKGNYLSPQELRKLNNQIVYYTLNNGQPKKTEETVAKLQAYSETLIYGNKLDSGKLKMLSIIFASVKCTDHFVVQVSKANQKHLKSLTNAIYVDEYLFNTVKNGTFVLPKHITDFMFANETRSFLTQDLAFIKNFKIIDNAAYTKYIALETTVDKIKIESGATGLSDNSVVMFKYEWYALFHELVALQKLHEKDGDKVDLRVELNKILPDAIISTDEIKYINVIKFDSTYDDIEYLSEYSSNIKGLLNNVSELCNPNALLSKALIEDIQLYVKALQD